MSYILNALRKSEQERQAIEPDSATNRIIVHQPPSQRHSTGLIAALIASNLAIVAYFLGFNPKTPPAVIQPVVPAVKPVEAPRAETIPPPPAVARPSEPKTPAFAEIVEAGSLPGTLPAAKPVAVKKTPVAPDKPVLDKPALAPPQPVIRQAEPESSGIVEPVPPPLKSDLPFMDELPAEIRRNLPDLPINVFGYSSVPAQRFVMIDMVKYLPGQRIKDLLELKEIREDSIVVGYNDLTFKIRRP